MSRPSEALDGAALEELRGDRARLSGWVNALLERGAALTHYQAVFVEGVGFWLDQGRTVTAKQATYLYDLAARAGLPGTPQKPMVTTRKRPRAGDAAGLRKAGRDGTGRR